jgi:hypothetical protein
MRILITGKPAWFEKDSHSAISFYRILTPLRELERQENVKIEESASAYEADIQKSDVVFLHTPNNDLSLQAVYNAKRWKRKIWVDFDDMVFDNDIPKSNLAWGFFNKPKQKKILKACISEAHIISVSTEKIKQRIVELYQYPKDQIVVVSNAIPNQIWKERAHFKPSTGKQRNIGWRGSVTHEGDLYKYRNGIKSHPNLSYLFIGHLPWVLHSDYDGHLNEMNYQHWFKIIGNYFDFLKTCAADYFIVPLENNSFNRGKSNIAWLEATFSGAACIAPDTMPEFAKEPVIKFNTPKSLDGVLKNIAKGTDLRTAKYLESRAVIEKNYLLSIVNKKRLEIINTLG